MRIYCAAKEGKHPQRFRILGIFPLRYQAFNFTDTLVYAACILAV